MPGWIQVGLIAVPLAWLFFYRRVILPAGLFAFNRARISTEYWATQFYRPGRLDKAQAGALSQSRRAQRAVALFDEAAGEESKGATVATMDRTLSISDDDARRGAVHGACPVCDAPIDVPLRGNRNTAMACGQCQASLIAKIEGDTMHLRAVVANPTRRVTTLNKRSLAVIYAEKAWLLRMMGRLNQALVTLDESEGINDELLRDDPENRDYRANKSLILFRRAEIRQIEGRLAEAREGYAASMQIDRELGDDDGAAVTEALLNELTPQASESGGHADELRE